MPQFDFVVVVRVTTGCSVSCSFCGFSRELQRRHKTIDVAGLRTLGASLQEFQFQFKRRVLVSWLGGEPFQWKLWLPISEEFQQRFGLALGVTTNGLAFRSLVMRRRATQLFSQITISVDGLADEHDSMRQSPDMFHALKACVTDLRREASNAANRPLLRVNTILTRRNIGQFTAFCREMAVWGFDELTFNPLGGNERPEFFADQHLTPDQVKTFGDQLPDIRRQMIEQGLLIRGSDRYVSRMLSSARQTAVPIDDCAPGTEIVFVDELGRLSPCSFTSESLSIPIHQLETGFEIAQLANRFRQRQRQCRPVCCNDCHATHVFEKFARPVKDEDCQVASKIRSTV